MADGNAVLYLRLSRDFSKDNISQLRVERKEITFSDASLEMAVLILGKSLNALAFYVSPF
jgi:hypothetical protein